MKATSDWLFYIGRLMDSAHVLAQAIWVRLLYLTGALGWAKRELRRRGAIVVFTFHRILDEAASLETDSLPFIVVRERTFEKLVRYVAKHYEPVDVFDATPGPVSRRLRAAFTMDDGWQDNYLHALPVLSEHKIPATVFLCTGLTGRTAPFWPEQIRRVLRPSLRERCGKRAEALIEALVESLKYCSPEARDQHVDMVLGQPANTNNPRSHLVDTTLEWSQVREMRGRGIRFGSHSHAHPILTAVPLDVASREIAESKQAFETMLSEECDLFAYPNGDWSPDVREQLREHRFRRAFTTERAAWLPETDPLTIPRAHIQQEDLVGLSGSFSVAMFEYATVWKIWLAMRRSDRQKQNVKTPQLIAAERKTA